MADRISIQIPVIYIKTYRLEIKYFTLYTHSYIHTHIYEIWFLTTQEDQSLMCENRMLRREFGPKKKGSNRKFYKLPKILVWILPIQWYLQWIVDCSNGFQLCNWKCQQWIQGAISLHCAPFRVAGGTTLKCGPIRQCSPSFPFKSTITGFTAAGTCGSQWKVNAFCFRKHLRALKQSQVYHCM